MFKFSLIQEFDVFWCRRILMTGIAGGKFSCGSKAEKRAGWWTSHEGSGLDIGLNLITWFASSGC